MAKKKPGEGNDHSFCFRCRKKDVDAFKKAAEAEGFGTNVSAWLLFHLRRIAKNAK